MGLTSKKLLVTVAVLAVALFVLTVWLWPRLARRGVRPVAGRVGMLFAGQLAILAALGLAINSYFGFYSSFADLLGTDQAPGQVIDYATAGSRGGLEEMGHQSVSVSGGSGWARAGRIDRVDVTGTRTGITAPAYVYLPPQYFQKAFRKQNFPAAVILTGYPGTAESLITRMRYPQTATQHIRQGRMQPMILVMMRPAVVPPRDTECMNVPHGPQVATFFADDLRAAVEANYRVGRYGVNWGVMGDSTGGYCALKLTLQYPRAFSAGVSLSGYYSTHDDPTTGDLFGGSERVRRESDLMWRLRHERLPAVWTLVTSSRRGEGNYRATLAFIRAVHPPMQVASILLPTGGHNFSTWNRELPGALDQLSHHVTQ